MHFAKMLKELDGSKKLTSRAVPQNVDLRRTFQFLKARIPRALVSARSDVPDLFNAILENAVSTSLVEAPSVQGTPPHVGQDLRSDLQKRNETVNRCRKNLKNKKKHLKETLRKLEFALKTLLDFSDLIPSFIRMFLEKL